MRRAPNIQIAKVLFLKTQIAFLPQGAYKRLPEILKLPRKPQEPGGCQRGQLNMPKASEN